MQAAMPVICKNPLRRVFAFQPGPFADINAASYSRANDAKIPSQNVTDGFFRSRCFEIAGLYKIDVAVVICDCRCGPLEY